MTSIRMGTGENEAEGKFEAPSVSETKIQLDGSLRKENCQKLKGGTRKVILAETKAPLNSKEIEWSTKTQEEISRSICVICMDHKRDISFSPCHHTQCCIYCFQRSQVHVCPICRTPVRLVTILETKKSLPVNIAAPKFTKTSLPRIHSSGTLEYQPSQHRASTIWRNPPTSSLQLERPTSSNPLISFSLSSQKIAVQAESSIRTSPRWQKRTEKNFISQKLFQNDSDNCKISRTELKSFGRDRDAEIQYSINNNQKQNVILLGHSKEVLKSLAKRLVSNLRKENERNGSLKSKSTILIKGHFVRLVLIESSVCMLNADLIQKIENSSPKLVILCADYYNLLSFESIVRFDMEVLEYFRIPSLWVLVKHTNSPILAPKNVVEQADILTAKHFFEKPRKCFTVNLGRCVSVTTFKRIESFLLKFFTTEEEFNARNDMLGEKNEKPRRKFSLFCLGQRSTHQENEKPIVGNKAKTLICSFF